MHLNIELLDDDDDAIHSQVLMGGPTFREEIDLLIDAQEVQLKKV
jgi:hypothetical protein